MLEILNKQEIENFITKGYVRIDSAFSEEIAQQALDILWKDLPCERFNPETWSEPVIRLGMYTQKPFIDSVNSQKLYKAFDQLVGRDKWLPCRSVGTFPVRFPTDRQPHDTGKHVDAGFPGKDPTNFFEWRVNIRSKSRALLILILYSEVTEKDAPTVIYEGSHLDVARMLQDKGDSGLSFMELAAKVDELPEGGKRLATGKPGTIYLCHPFLVHSAQPHRGKSPKFMAQPPLLLREELTIDGPDAGYAPVERAIRLGLGMS